MNNNNTTSWLHLQHPSPFKNKLCLWTGLWKKRRVSAAALTSMDGSHQGRLKHERELAIIIIIIMSANAQWHIEEDVTNYCCTWGCCVSWFWSMLAYQSTSSRFKSSSCCSTRSGCSFFSWWYNTASGFYRWDMQQELVGHSTAPAAVGMQTQPTIERNFHILSWWSWQ